MKKILIGTIILCILHSILLVTQDFGINVLLFTIPLLAYIIYMMKDSKVIINKKGLLLIIPIILLSLTYFIYDNTFKGLNILVIPVLYFLMYIFTIKPVNTFGDAIIEILNFMVKPLNFIGKYTKEGVSLIPKEKKGKREKKKINQKVLKSLLIVLPIVIVVLLLLSSADSIFSSIFTNIFHLNFEWIPIDQVVPRTIAFILMFFYLGATIYYICNEYIDEKRIKQERKEHDSFTLNMLLVILNIIYLVFDIIQINSLMLHRVSTGFNYAEYARSGFFQLMLISFINIAIILFSKKCKEELKTKIMSIIMVLLTYIIIVSSFYRMFLYEQAYGYTVLRLGVYAILVTEGILLIPTIIYILNKKINILNCYMIIMISAYSLVNCFSVDRIIAQNNIERYARTGKIDIYYLENNNYDNLNQLRVLNKAIEKDTRIEEYDKMSLKAYIETMDKDNKTNILEYNLSKEKAKEKRD